MLFGFFSVSSKEKASKSTKCPSKTPYQLSRGFASLPSLEENIAKLCWVDHPSNSVA